MVRSGVRPPPIDVVAATSAMSSSSSSPSSPSSFTSSRSVSPVSSASSIISNLYETGLIQIHPPQCHTEDYHDALQYSDLIEFDDFDLDFESSESTSSSSSSNKHNTPPYSLPSSPAFTVSPISPTFAGLTHITFADSGIEQADSNSFMFIPVTWISSDHIGDDESHFLCAGYSKGAQWSSSPTSPSHPSHTSGSRKSKQPLLPSSPFDRDWPPPPSPTIPCSPFQSSGYSPYISPIPSPQQSGFGLGFGGGEYLTAGDFSMFLSKFPVPPLDRPAVPPCRPQSPRSSRPSEDIRIHVQDENSVPCAAQALDDAASSSTGRRQSRLWNRRARIVS
ncbi:hypothetical protein M422DRAFT_31323 [Sphaerobolus stellatus SS14]|uniref:Unplaced genomic scaffold SPHSTscaffold_208, whole genome shotgun sequence n=1 Tax=Sphaerobolus stellatus (strain SS14) TaxID=990650 RepID=A0A0C9TIQ0_SPHS4|nr:hypothetical protein M422DRAFT_36944 [Sphaerobolus stellatus SS14]KIJ42352.1 hypothetical protein M422DRAFT_31323 [Sphaerobolus stellatus SS14]